MSEALHPKMPAGGWLPAARVCAKSPLANLGVALISFVLTLVALELLLPLFVEVTDNIDYEALPHVGLRLRPDQDGLYIRNGLGIRARFHVNNAGFNNPNDYIVARYAGVHRVAVVGDSFVEAFQVNSGSAFFSLLERELNRYGAPVEVYSFGVSGYGTSQVYHLLRDYVLQYQPDAVIYLFIPNDVSDSARCREDKRWTPQYDLAPNGSLVALPYEPYRITRLKGLLKHSRLFRYLAYQQRLLELGRQKTPPPSAAAVAPDSCEGRSWRIVEQLLVRMDELMHERGIPWLLVWQGDADPEFYPDVHRRVEEISTRHHLPYYDLSRGFAAAPGPHAFRIPGDGHWNARGHAVAGAALVPLTKKMLALDRDGRNPRP